MVRKLALLIIFFASFKIFSQSIEVTASVDTTDYLIGDYINYSLVITAGSEVHPIRPFFRDSLNSIDIVKELEPQKLGDKDKKIFKYNYVLSRYDSAEVIIPGIKIDYRIEGDSTLKSIVSNPVTFNVHSIKISEQEDIKDVKEPIKIPLNWVMILVWVLLAIVILVAGYYIYKKYFAKKEVQITRPKKVEIPSYQIALKNLSKLETEQLWQKGHIKDYHSKITEIIRKYFEDRFYFPSLELTSTESLELLEKQIDGKNVVSVTEQFFSNADLVKFAKYQPIAFVNEEMMKQAREIVNSTIPSQKVLSEVADVQ